MHIEKRLKQALFRSRQALRIGVATATHPRMEPQHGYRPEVLSGDERDATGFFAERSPPARAATSEVAECMPGATSLRQNLLEPSARKHTGNIHENGDTDRYQ